MLSVSDGVTKLVPTFIEAVPVCELNHVIVPPEQPVAESVTVPVPHLLPSIMVGEAGIVFTTTFAVAVAVQPALLITVTVYTPAIAVIAVVLVGFCKVDVNELGPLHE